jgi:hypothetical protein
MQPFVRQAGARTIFSRDDNASFRPVHKHSAPANRIAGLEEPMKVYEAMSDVHFRFTDDSRVIRCCGVCGIALEDGTSDPCRDARACNERRAMSTEGEGTLEVVGVPCGVG